MSDGGKGSAPRKQQDHDAYSKNWDAIFGKKDSLSKMIADENERMKLYEKDSSKQNNG
jgi:hypothetical protein